jgi:hypothetical protein
MVFVDPVQFIIIYAISMTVGILYRAILGIEKVIYWCL